MLFKNCKFNNFSENVSGIKYDFFTFGVCVFCANQNVSLLATIISKIQTIQIMLWSVQDQFHSSSLFSYEPEQKVTADIHKVQFQASQ